MMVRPTGVRKTILIFGYEVFMCEQISSEGDDSDDDPEITSGRLAWNNLYI